MSAVSARLALDAIGQIPDSELDLAGAALQFARIDAPEDNWQAAAAHLSELARDAAALAVERSASSPAVRAAALAGLLTGHWRYGGDVATYDHPDNANLIRVIARRRGLPVALGVLWLHCARAAGWEAYGVDFPGHFMIALPGSGTQLVLDVFDGGEPMSAQALRGLIKRMEGPKAELRPGLLQPMSPRAVLLRLQHNLKLRRLRANDQAGALTAIEDMLRVAPDRAGLWREAAALHQRLGGVAEALHCLECFLALVPQGPAAESARAMLGELRK